MRNSCRLFVLLATIGILMLLVTPSYSQINTGTLTGVVEDPSQAAIPGAQVQVFNEGTGRVKKTVSNAEGQFTFTFLVPGTYDLSVSAKGFEQLRRSGLALQAGQVLNVNLQLKLGSTTQTVTVSGRAPLLEGGSSNQLDTVTDAEVKQLPQAKLDWTSLTDFIPGLLKVTTAGTGASLVMNGLAPHSMNFTVDGTNASGDSRAPSFGFYQSPNVINTLNADAIAEVSVVKGIMPASIGGTMSGNVNLISKSGTNNFHGDIYEVNSLNDYNARNQFLSTKPRSTFNQFGGSLGGPIIKDKFFFFGSYEGVRTSEFSPISADVPTPYLESISPAVYDPIFSAFPKVAQPTDDPTALTVRFNGAGSFVQNDDNTSERFDYFISPANDLTFRYTRDTPFEHIPRAIAINPRNYNASSNMVNINFVHTAGTWTSSSRFGYNENYILRIDEGFNSDLEGVSFAGFNSGGAESNNLRGSTYTYMEDASLIHGRNLFGFGGIVQRQNWGHVDLNTVSLSYSSLSDFQNNIPSKAEITFDVPLSYIHTYQFGGYFQDNYKATKKLTLNLGVRYDYFTVPKERDGRLFNRGIDPTQPQLGYGFGPYRPPSSIYNADYNNVQPRVGFAWTVGSSGKTVIRGGFGVYVSPHPMHAGVVLQVQAGPSIPFRSTLSRDTVVAAGLGYPLPRSSFIPTLDYLQSAGILSTNIASYNVIPGNYPNPYSMQWMMEVQRELGYGTVLSMGYNGNRGLKLIMAPVANLPNRLTGIAPDPNFSQFTVVAPWDESSYNALQVKLRKRFSHGLSFGAYYTYAKGTAYCGGDVVRTCTPQQFNNFRADLGPTDFDIRNDFSGTLIYQLPFARWAGLQGRTSKALVGGWTLSEIFTANDGLPVNVTNGNSSYPADRPDSATGVAAILSNYQSTLHYLNPAAFTTIPIISASGAQERPGNLGRDAFFAPGMWNSDTSLAKSFSITEKVRLQLRGDFFNTFNHTNLTGLVTNLSSGSFGTLTSATARTLQISARLSF